MKFHPAISITLGTITVFILPLILNVFTGVTPIPIIVFIVAIMLGGFIATYFSKENKMQYGIYEGIIIIAIFIILAALTDTNDIDILSSLIGVTLVVILPVSIGSYLGKTAGEYLKQKHGKSTV